MTIEIGDNGLRDRYWWSSHEVPSDEPATAAYQAIRGRCPFLVEGNHTWRATDHGEGDPRFKKLKELTQSSRYSITIRHADGSYWFHMAYRVPGEPY